MTGFAISQRAFRFKVGAREFAIDIQSNIVFDVISVSLYEQQPGGQWFNKYIEFGQPDLRATDEAITNAGGVVPFCRLIVARVNRALDVVFGATVTDPPASLAEQVQEHLLKNLTVFTVNGKPQVKL